jgi:hypothetical protein
MKNTTRLTAAAMLLSAAATTLAQEPRPLLSTCSPVSTAAVHAFSRTGENPFPPGQRLARIESGTVPCMHIDEAAATRCAFRTEPAASGSWLEDRQGRRFAQAGQRLAKDGAPGGEYVVTAQVTDNKVACVDRPLTRDAVGTSASMELAVPCVVEVMGSAKNALNRPLRNHATIPVCTSSYPHPDGARLHSVDKAAGVYCYIGEGAGLNDPNGWERDARGQYLTGYGHCHVAWSGGVEVFAAKRPATIAFPTPGRVNPKTPIVWRPVSSVRVAN